LTRAEHKINNRDFSRYGKNSFFHSQWCLVHTWQ